MIRGVHRRSTFELLRHGQTVRVGALTLRHADTGRDIAEIAFSIRRHAAPAVRRNRCRRRLRALLAAADRGGELVPGVYLLSVRDDAVDASFSQWQQWLSRALSQLARRRSTA